MEEKNRLPELSERMMTAANMVTRGSRLGDIGCDHGYVSIYLYNSGICPFCIAADVNPGPLKGAAENIRLYGADKGVAARLSDGLKAFKAGEVDTILIMGMGGGLMERILNDRKDVVLMAREIICEPQSEPERVRRLLNELGFVICREDFVAECGKYYPVIKGVKADKAGELSQAELKYGPCLIKGDNALFRDYLLKERRRIGRILQGLERAGNAPERRDELEKELSLIDSVLNKSR